MSGSHAVQLVAAPAASGTARISRVCVTQDGTPVTVSSSANTKGFTQFYGGAGFGWVGNGCFDNSYSGAVSLSLTFDSTTWENGSRTYTATTTDSAGRTATSNTLTINHTNPQPSASVRHFDSRPSGLHQLELGISLANSTDEWSTLCVVNPSAGIAVTVAGWTTSPNNCWTPPVANRRATSVAVTVDTVNSNSTSHSLSLQLTDNIGRKAPVRHEFGWTRPELAVEILGVAPNNRLTGTLSLSLVALVDADLRSRTKITDFCLAIQGQACAPSATIQPQSVEFLFDTALLRDGNHVLTGTIKDSLGRTASRSFPVIIANGVPLIGDLLFVTPSKKRQQATSVEVVFGLSRAATATIRFREATGKQSTVLQVPITKSGAPEARLTIPNLVAGKDYIFEVSAENANGRVVSKQTKHRRVVEERTGR